MEFYINWIWKRIRYMYNLFLFCEKKKKKLFFGEIVIFDNKKKSFEMFFFFKEEKLVYGSGLMVFCFIKYVNYYIFLNIC